MQYRRNGFTILKHIYHNHLQTVLIKSKSKSKQAPKFLDLRDQTRATSFVCSSTSARQVRAVRPVPIKLITVSKGSNAAAQALAGEWAEKLQRYTKLTEHNIKSNPKRASDIKVIRAGEAERVLKVLTPQDTVIVLDERGHRITSQGLADLLADAGDNGASSLVFCIGGPYGHAASIRDRADSVISVSSLVLNHQVAVVVLLEALYRAHTILRGEPYHH